MAINEWITFTTKTFELLIGCYVSTALINNFFIKTYIPGDLMFSLDPCGPPYMNPESNEIHDKININRRASSKYENEQQSLYEVCGEGGSSFYDKLKEYKNNNNNNNSHKGGGNENNEINEKNSKLNEINKITKQYKISDKEILEKIPTVLKELSSPATIDLNFMYDALKNLNKSRAGKVRHHGILSELMLSICIVYMAGTITGKSIIKIFNDLLSNLNLYNSSIAFTILMFLLLGSIVANGVLSTLIGIMVFFLGLISIFGLIFTFVNLWCFAIYAPITLISTLIFGAFMISCGLGIIQALILTVQLIIYYIIQPFTNKTMKSITNCGFIKNKTIIITLLILMTLGNVNNSFEDDKNKGITMFVVIMSYLIYIFKNFFSKNSVIEIPPKECAENNRMIELIRKISLM